MITLYVEGSKKAANEALMEGKQVTGIEYILGQVNEYKLPELKMDAVIKFYKNRDQAGNPIAQSYGNWRYNKKMIL